MAWRFYLVNKGAWGGAREIICIGVPVLTGFTVEQQVWNLHHEPPSIGRELSVFGK